MADTDREFEHESLQDRTTIARYLKAIEEGFAKGSLSLRNRNGEIVLEPKGLIDLTVKASKKRGRIQLSLEASWKVKDRPEDVSGRTRPASPGADISSQKAKDHVVGPFSERPGL